MNLAKNRVAITISLCFILVFFIIIISTYYKKVNSDVSRAEVTVSQTALYIVKNLNGKIAIYKYGEQTPMQVLEDPYVDNLPPIDQQRLSEGINVFSEDELNSLVEDLAS